MSDSLKKKSLKSDSLEFEKSCGDMLTDLTRLQDIGLIKGKIENLVKQLLDFEFLKSDDSKVVKGALENFMEYLIEISARKQEDLKSLGIVLFFVIRKFVEKMDVLNYEKEDCGFLFYFFWNLFVDEFLSGLTVYNVERIKVELKKSFESSNSSDHGSVFLKIDLLCTILIQSKDKMQLEFARKLMIFGEEDDKSKVVKCRGRVLGKLYFLENNFGKALECYSSYLEDLGVNKTNDELFATRFLVVCCEIHFRLLEEIGMCYIKLNRFQEGRKLFKKLFHKTDNSNAVLFFHYANYIISFDPKYKEEAIACLKRVKSLLRQIDDQKRMVFTEYTDEVKKYITVDLIRKRLITLGEHRTPRPIQNIDFEKAEMVSIQETDERSNIEKELKVIRSWSKLLDWIVLFLGNLAALLLLVVFLFWFFFQFFIGTLTLLPVFSLVLILILGFSLFSYKLDRKRIVNLKDLGQLDMYYVLGKEKMTMIGNREVFKVLFLIVTLFLFNFVVIVTMVVVRRVFYVPIWGFFEYKYLFIPSELYFLGFFVVMTILGVYCQLKYDSSNAFFAGAIGSFFELHTFRVGTFTVAALFSFICCVQMVLFSLYLDNILEWNVFLIFIPMWTVLYSMFWHACCCISCNFVCFRKGQIKNASTASHAVLFFLCFVCVLLSLLYCLFVDLSIDIEYLEWSFVVIIPILWVLFNFLYCLRIFRCGGLKRMNQKKKISLHREDYERISEEKVV